MDSSKRNANWDEQFHQEIFQVLNESRDVEEGIQTALGMIGERYRISRVYIFENCEDARYANNTFEWCAPGIEPAIHMLQHLSYKEYGYDQFLFQTGEFHCPDVDRLDNQMLQELVKAQGIRAMLQFALYDKGNLRGLVGFDDCRSVRPDWKENSECSNALIYLSNFLNVYLIKERNLQAATLYQQELEASLQAAQKANAAKNDFLSNMSHEIRTPMNAILGMTELAMDEVQELPKAKQYVEKIRTSSKYLLGVINEILDMSRIDSGSLELNLEWVSPQEVVSSVYDMIQPLAEARNISFQYDEKIRKPASFEMFVDCQKTRQLLMNLLNNACKFTAPGGTVQVDFYNVLFDPDNHRAKDQIVIRDTGCGMTPEFLERIFSPFEQERLPGMENVPGTGLGLTISRDIARQMGGDITVESKLGEGSVFTLTYGYRYRPISTEDRIEQADPPDQSYDCLKGKRVLLAEDNALNAEITIHLLKKRGIRVDHAVDGAEALEILEQSEPESYDLVLMDIRMPVMDGLEAARRIRNQARKDIAAIPILAMSANAYEEDRKTSLAAGMNAHLSKPVEPEVLYRAIAEYARDTSKVELARFDLLQGMRILLCEDNRLSQMIVEDLLEMKGCHVTSAENGQQAVDLFRSSSVNAFDLILMDVHMPVMDGLEASRQIRALPRPDAAEIPIVAMSADDPLEESKVPAIEGFNAYLHKPVEAESLYQQIQRFNGKAEEKE